MADNFRRTKIAHPATSFQIATRQQAIDEPGGKLIARPCGIDRHHLFNRDIVTFVARNDRHTVAGAGADHQRDHSRRFGHGVLKVIRLKQRHDLVFIANDKIQLVLDHVQEIGAVPVHAEGIGNGDTCLTATRAGQARSLAERFFALVLVKEVSFEKDHVGGGGHCLGHVIGAQFGGNAQIGVHRPFTIRRHKNHRPRGGQFAALDRIIHKIGATVLHGFGIEFAQGVVMHPADKSRWQTQRAHACNRVGHGPAGSLQPIRHSGIEHFAPVLFDQLHNPLFDPHQVEKGIVSMGNHVDNGIADARKLVLGHSVLSSKGQRSRMMQVGHCGLRALQW
mmetsp:Transcript_7578/g.13062  ORF Transcript_7578/g.13062 Transcript_7578/m.13062 type:complete len:336 (-) Transcript_7578:587-1594(-)